MGTLCASNTNQVDDSETKRYLINFYNAVERRLFICPGYNDDNAVTSYTTTSTSYTEANGAGNGTVNFLSDGQKPVKLVCQCQGTAGAGGLGRLGLGIDSTTTATASSFIGDAASANGNGMVEYTNVLGAGRHFATMLIVQRTSGTLTIFADVQRDGSSADPRASYLEGVIWG